MCIHQQQHSKVTTIASNERLLELVPLIWFKKETLLDRTVLGLFPTTNEKSSSTSPQPETTTSDCNSSSSLSTKMCVHQNDPTQLLPPSTPASPVGGSGGSLKMHWQRFAHEAYEFDHHRLERPFHQSNGGHPSAPAAAAVSSPAILKQNLLDLIAHQNHHHHHHHHFLKCDTNWVQVSGHEDSFALAGPGTIWKRHSPNSTEVSVYQALMTEPIAEMIPKFYRSVTYKGENFIELEDLLCHFGADTTDVSIIDIKMGVRTFLESEVCNNTVRKDLYEKMMKVDPNEPTTQEHEQRAVTKLRYMKLRDARSSTSNLGFRIGGFKVGDTVQHDKNLPNIKKASDVQKMLESFFTGKQHICHSILARLKTLRKLFENSPFFRTHEVIGSSLLIVYTGDRAGVWMIDFAKTFPVPDCIGTIDHRKQWKMGNHEDGYLFGLDNLIATFTDIVGPVS